jgi:hypothetical protein
MANHAKVCTGKTLDPNEVNDIVQKLNKEKLNGIFTLKYDVNYPGGWADHQWTLQYKNEDYIALQFWLSDDVEYGEEKDGEYTEYDEPKILSKQSCIEFRHGHSYNFMWWVEGVFRENLGKHYDARMWDDGCGWIEEERRLDRYESFESYVRTLCKDPKSKKLVKEMKDFKFPDWQVEDIPKELIDALNLDFKV